ncbi:MAG TPA: lipid-A-disaccharide synthase [Candidatus Tectomicrobia bacterium]|nr:lipid-A-disaccharide synthase [Candidatus Tectomicrobia bacterium]
MTQRLMIIAGEASGDLHGGNLARALLAQQPTLQLLGVGGHRMHKAGVELLFDIRDLAVVGAVEAVHSLRTLWRVYRMVLDEVERAPVAASLLIDFPGFNLKLAAALTQRNIPVLYYIAPQVWAWHPRRMKKIRRRVRKLFVILPFEDALYHQAQIDAEFVGHPLLDLVRPTGSKADACTRCGLDPAAPVVGILPGSRRSELHYLLGPMLEAAAQIRARVTTCQFILPLADTLQPADIQGALEAAPLPVQLVQRRTYDVMQAADVLLVASGTATLEAALLGTPMVIVYKAHLLTYLLARLVMRVGYIGLPNIIAGRAIVPELWQYEVTAKKLAAQALALLAQPERATAMRTELATLRSELGAPGVPERVACGILRYLEAHAPQSIVVGPNRRLS